MDVDSYWWYLWYCQFLSDATNWAASHPGRDHATPLRMKNLLFPKNLSAIKILPRPSAAVIATARTSDMDDMDDMDIVNEKHSAKVKGPQGLVVSSLLTLYFWCLKSVLLVFVCFKGIAPYLPALSILASTVQHRTPLRGTSGSINASSKRTAVNASALNLRSSVLESCCNYDSSCIIWRMMKMEPKSRGEHFVHFVPTKVRNAHKTKQHYATYTMSHHDITSILRHVMWHIAD